MVINGSANVNLDYLHSMITPEEVKAKTIERFWTKIKFGEMDDCWEWISCIGRQGYGIFNIHPKCFTAPRLIYIILFGNPEKGLQVLHKCDNRKCVNPNHLFLGTGRDNMEDMRKKGRDFKFPLYQGSKHGRSKLNENDIIEIHKRFKNGESYPLIAESYGVTSSLVGLIIRRKLWKHVDIENTKQIAV